MKTGSGRKSYRVLVLAALPVAGVLMKPGMVSAATFTWTGAKSNYIGTASATASKSNWVESTAPGNGSVPPPDNNDLAILPDTLTGITSPEPIYISTTSNPNSAYQLGGFEVTDASSPNINEYQVFNNDSLAFSTLYLNGVSVSGVGNSSATTILADATTATATTLAVGVGGKGTLFLELGNTSNYIYAATNDLVSISAVTSELTSPSTITMAGGGVLSFSAANTFSGGVIVNNSTLQAAYTGATSGSTSSTGSGNVTLNGATLTSLAGVTSYISGSVSQGTGSSIIAAGGVDATTGTLDIGSTLSLSGSSTLDFGVNGTSADALTLGTLNIASGKPTINLDSVTFPSGNIVLATYSTSDSLSDSSFNLPTAPSGYGWNITDSEIELQELETPANVTWAPASGASGTWNTTAGNWTGGTPTADLYKNGDTANFDNIGGSTSGTVTVGTGGVTPANVLVNNSSTTYTLTDQDGTNGIGGAGSLTKSGTGTLVLSAPNQYSGGTAINGGTVVASADNALGAGSGGVSLASATLVAGGALTSARTITVNTGGGTFNTGGFSSITSGGANINDTFSVSGTSGGGLEIDGPVTFTSTGALNIGANTNVTLGNSGTITQINSSTYTGTLTVTGTPTLGFDNASSVFGGTGAINVTNPGTTTLVSGATPYYTYATGVTITNAKVGGVATQGGTIEVPINLNSTNMPFTKTDVTSSASPLPLGNFTVNIGASTGGNTLIIDGVISGNSDVDFANGVLSGGGAGDLILEKSNTYTGASLVNISGTMQLATTDALPTGTDVMIGTINGAISTNTTIDLDGFNQQWNSLSDGPFPGHKSENITDSSSNPSTLTIGGAITPANPFEGVISDGNGEVTLQQSGTGTLELTGTSTYSGGTNLNSGTIEITQDVDLGGLGVGTGSVNFNGGTLLLNGQWTSTKPLAVNPGNSTLNGATNTVSLTPSGLTWNGGTLAIENAGVSSLTPNSNFSTVSVTAPGTVVSIDANTTLDVNGGSFGDGIDPFSNAHPANGIVTAANSVAIVNNGNLNIVGGTTTNGVEGQPTTSIAGITGTGTLSVGQSGSPTVLQLAQGSGKSVVNSLVINSNATLDITNNHLIINYGAAGGGDPMTTVYQWLKEGYNNGSWNGGVGFTPSIISSSAQTLTNGLKYGIGWADGNDGVHDVAGLSTGQIELKYTLLGDANLDGSVNGSDFSILAANFGLGVTNWDQGNFLYSSSVNGSDFSALAANFGQGDSGADATVTPADITALDAFAAANGLPLPTFAVVPEPASVGLAALGAVGMLARRRRRE
jgi:autotransporter-associated beta strand protein